MSAAEVRGYLTHGLRQAGGNISGILTDDAVSAVHTLSEGIPRVINNLVGAALESAADKDMQRLDAAELARVAEDEFGIDTAPLAAINTDSGNASPAVAAAEAPAPETSASPAPEFGDPVQAPAVEATEEDAGADDGERRCSGPDPGHASRGCSAGFRRVPHGSGSVGR